MRPQPPPEPLTEHQHRLQHAADVIAGICGADVATARAALLLAAPGSAQLKVVLDHLGKYPDALRSGSSAAPKPLLRVVLALHEAGVEQIVAPRCVDCAHASTRLDYLVPGGRICGACRAVRRSGPCRVCGQHRPAVSQDETRAPICPACASKSSAHVRPCGNCGIPTRVALRVTGPGPTLVLGRCCAAPLAARCTVCGWRNGVHAYKTRRPLCALCAAGPRTICASCGLDAPHPADPDAPPCCARCTRRKPVPCRDCGTLTARRARPGEPPQCHDCVLRPVGACGRCGRERVIVRRAVDEDPDLCGVCWHGPVTSCANCGHQRQCRGQRRGVMLCQSCAPRRLHRCARCGRDRRSGTELGEGRLCHACYNKALAAKGTCPRCGLTRRLLTYPNQPDAICADCAGVAARRVCQDCGAEDLLYDAGRCPSCTLRARLTTLFGPPGQPRRPELEPLRAALQDAAVARSIVEWLQRSESGRLLKAMIVGDLDVSHAGLDALPPSGSGRFLDHLLVAADVLPERDPVLARLEATIARTLDAANLDSGDRRTVRTWLTWAVLPKRRRPPAVSEGSANGVKSILRAVLDLLTTLDEQDKLLANLDQASLDAWITTQPERYRLARPFLTWSARRHLTTRLHLPAPSTPARRPVQPADWALARRLLHDPLPDPTEPDRSNQIRVRIAGLLVLLYAQPLSRISRLTLTAVTIDDTHVQLTLGNTAVTCPPGLADLLTAHIAERRYLNAVQPLTDPGWLFPGRSPGQPIGPTSLAKQLRAINLHTSAARPAALLHLASTMAAAVVADLLGVSIHTVTELTRTTGSTWARYAGTRTTPNSIRRPTNN